MKERIAITAYMVGAIFIAFVSGFAHNGIAYLPEIIGYAVGFLFFPAVIAYGFYGRIGKRPNNPHRFARLLWWSTVVALWMASVTQQRNQLTAADVKTVVKQAANMNPNSEIDNQGKSAEKVEKEAQIRDLMRAFFTDIARSRQEFDVRRTAIDTRIDGIYQPASYTPARAKHIIAALNENIVLDNDIQTWANNVVLMFQARVNQSHLTGEEKQDTMRGFQSSIANSPLWPTLHMFLNTDIQFDRLSIQFYQAIREGNTKQANNYLDRIQELGKKDTELAAQVTKLRDASIKEAGVDGSEKIFQQKQVQQ